MKLTLVRHATAIGKESSIIDDYRYLTADGRMFFRKTARTLLKKKISPAVILTSPLLRAVQTADILAETLQYEGPLLVREELAKGFSLKELQKLAEEFSGTDDLVLVGHDPDLSVLVRILLKKPSFSMKKGMAVRLKIDAAALSLSAEFKWVASGKNLVTDLDEIGAA